MLVNPPKFDFLSNSVTVNGKRFSPNVTLTSSDIAYNSSSDLYGTVNRLEARTRLKKTLSKKFSENVAINTTKQLVVGNYNLSSFVVINSDRTDLDVFLQVSFYDTLLGVHQTTLNIQVGNIVTLPAFLRSGRIRITPKSPSGATGSVFIEGFVYEEDI
ncbi:MAG: hypothetical protein ACRCTB_00845 [Vibrio sp.]